MKTVIAVSLLFSSHLCAQVLNPGARSASPAANLEYQRRIQNDAFEKWANDPDSDKKTVNAQQAAAIAEFYSKASHFVEVWQKFAGELNEKKAFNAKLAKQVSKAFHDLEQSDGWPIGRSK